MLSRLLSDRLVKAGLVLLVVGTGPLLAIIVAAKLGLTRDPNPNPIGPGLLAFVTFWPSTLMIGFGTARAVRRGGDDPGGESLQTGPLGNSTNSPAASMGAFARSPGGRGLVAAGGVLLFVNGMGGLTVDARGGAAAMVIGVVCLWFAATGRMPSWFRR